MPYIGNTIRAADDYRLIDDISSGFNGSTTSFALQVAGSAPVPFPKSPQQVLISVNGVIQEPDPTGASGFNLVGTNIVFSSAPTNGHAFFGIIYATADYLNAGGNFPSGSLGAPSITFIGDENSGLYRKGSGSVGFVSDATEIANFDSNGITISNGNIIIPDKIIHNGDTDTAIRFPADDIITMERSGTEVFRLDSAGLKIPDKLIHTGDTDTFLEFGTDQISLDTGGSEKIRINNSTYIQLYDHIVPNNDSTKDIGLTGTRFRAAYVDTYYGDGSNLTGISGTTINTNADNRIITGSGTANTLNGESNFTFSGTKAIVQIGATSTVSDRGLMFQATSNLSADDVLPGITFNPNTNADRPRAGIAAVSVSGVSGMNLIFMTRNAGDGSQLTASDEKLRLDTNGRLILGATSTIGNSYSDNFTISEAANVGMQFAGNNSTSNYGSIYFGDSGHRQRHFLEAQLGTNGQFTIGTIGSGAIRFTNSGGEGMRLTGSTLRIATTGGNPHANADELVLGDNSGSVRGGMTINSGANLDGSIHFGDPDSNTSGQINYDHNTDALSFYAGGNKRVRIDSDGLKFGTSASAADAIDDYEEGTYTAHFAIEGQGNMTMSGRVGLYIKVGQMVTVIGGGTCASTTGAGTGNAIEFSNLPFPMHNSASSYGHPFPVKLFNMDATGLNNMSGSRPYIFKGRLFTDGTHGRIEGERSDSAQQAVNSSLCLSTSTEIQYMFTYRTDA